MAKLTLFRMKDDQKKESNKDEDKTSKPRSSEVFLKGLSLEGVDSNVGQQVNQLLKKYRALKIKLEENNLEVRNCSFSFEIIS